MSAIRETTTTTVHTPSLLLPYLGSSSSSREGFGVQFRKIEHRYMYIFYVFAETVLFSLEKV